jgi:hypothetical protein
MPYLYCGAYIICKYAKNRDKACLISIAEHILYANMPETNGDKACLISIAEHILHVNMPETSGGDKACLISTQNAKCKMQNNNLTK